MTNQAIGTEEGGSEPPFGVNEMRLNARQWLMVASIVLAVVIALPRIWTHAERFDTPTDYRIPYPLSSDYRLFERRLDKLQDPNIVPVLGDSVVWGEYVRPDGTLTHFLNQEAEQPDRFANCGVNGVFPLAEEGLIAYYGSSLRNRKVILQCNVLWMSSPKADLSIPTEETFNHAGLVPQFFERIRCYHADASARLGVVAERSIDFFGWVNHVNSVYFDNRSIPTWTLEEDSGNPPASPNAWRNPLAQITLNVPGEPIYDPQRGPTSPRHRPWNANGGTPTHFDWVSLDSSLQWRAFQRTVKLLRSRGCDVLVILGPFNEHMIAAEQLPIYRTLRDGISNWLTANRVPHIVTELLPSDLYADASHPLTNGYALLASRIYRDMELQRWLDSN